MDLSTLAIHKALNNQWREAVDLNEQILSQFPENVDALNRLAQAYMQLNNFAKAKCLYDQVLKLDHYNPIAKRNLLKLKSLSENGQITTLNSIQHFNFIEEPGKAKVVTLVRLGERGILSTVQPCLELSLQVRAQSICVYYKKDYIGRLPDDIGKRLIWLLKQKNKYAAYIKSADINKVTVFLKEIKRSKKYENHHCSLFTSDK